MTVNVTVIARNHPKLAVQAVFERGQSILTPGGPSAMSRSGAQVGDFVDRAGG
jgi:hypothetical protein